MLHLGPDRHCRSHRDLLKEESVERSARSGDVAAGEPRYGAGSLCDPITRRSAVRTEPLVRIRSPHATRSIAAPPVRSLLGLKRSGQRSIAGAGRLRARRGIPDMPPGIALARNADSRYSVQRGRPHASRLRVIYSSTRPVRIAAAASLISRDRRSETVAFARVQYSTAGRRAGHSRHRAARPAGLVPAGILQGWR